MKKAISCRKLAASWSRWLLLTSAPMALLACQHDLMPGSKEVMVEAVTGNSALPQATGPMFSQGRLADSSQPMLANLVDNGDLSDGLRGWLYRGGGMHYSAEEGYLKPGSLMIKNRMETWHGPVVRLPALESRKAYRATAWIKPVDTDRSARARLILTRVTDGELNSITLADLEATPKRWQKLEGEFIGGTYHSEEVAILVLDVDDTKVNYYLDDLVVTYAELSDELQAAAAAAAGNVVRRWIRNGDVEDGLEYWSHQGGVISRSSAQAQSGKYSLLITGRNQGWNGPSMAVNGLENNTRYRISIYGRIAEGQADSKLQLTMKRVTDGQTSFIPITQVEGVSREWRELAGVFTSPNITRSQIVSLYVEAADPLVSFYVDNLTIEELP